MSNTSKRAGSAASTAVSGITQPPARMLTAEELDMLPGCEILEKRTECRKVYSLDGTHSQSVTFSDAAHYRDRQNAWCDIDNTFAWVEGADAVASRSGPLQARCGASYTAPFIALTDLEGHTLSYGIKGARSTQPVIDAPADIDSADTSMRACRERVARRLYGTVHYTGIFDKTDLSCQLGGRGFKDAVVFGAREAAKDIAFILSAPQMRLVMREDGTINALDNEGKVCFVLPAPYMSDANDEHGAVRTTLTQEGDLWHIVCSPDAAFLDKAAYPVSLDPAVYIPTNVTGIADTYVKSSSPNSNYETDSQLWVCDNSTYGIRYSYLLVDSAQLPEISESNYITKAYLAVSLYTKPTENTAVYLSEITSAWAPDTVTYNTKPTHHSLYQDYVVMSATASIQNYYSYDVTSLVRKWYRGSNLGVVLTPQSDYPNTVRMYSKEGIRPPYLVINYNSLAGLEGYLSYDTCNIGRAGTGYVSLYNGNLIFAHSDSATGGQLLPVSLTHYYNSCDGNLDWFSLGRGWRTNVHRTLHRETLTDSTGTGVLYYVYTDEDGTRHHFKLMTGSTTEYEDLSGLAMKLTVNGSAVVIRDKGDNAMDFDLPTTDFTGSNTSAIKMIKDLKDAIGNTVTVNSTGLKITSVVDGSGRTTTLTYNAAGRLSGIAAPGQACSFVYTSVTLGGVTYRLLSEITHNDGEKTYYAYVNAGTSAAPFFLLNEVTDVDARTVTFVYENTGATGGLPHQVTRMYLTGGTLTGLDQAYDYGSRMTAVTDALSGKSLIYRFNDYGNMVSVNDGLGYSMHAGFSNDYPLNHPDTLSRLQRVVTNLLTDHSFERASTLWVHGNISGSGTFLRDQTTYYMGLVSYKITVANNGESYVQQERTLTPGSSYTLSMYTKAPGATNASLRLRYQDSGGAWHAINSDPINNINAFVRLSLPFTLPVGSMGTVQCRLVCKAGSAGAGSVWFDCVQLEAGLTVNRYDLLENSDFETLGTVLPALWEKDSASSDTFYEQLSGQTLPYGLTGNVLEMKGRYDRSIGVYQEMRAYGNANDKYVAGGWSLAFGKESATAAFPTARHCVNVQFRCGDWVTGGRIYWNYQEGEWQYACGSAIAPDDYTEIRFYVQYNAQMNYADFTNLFLYKEQFGDNITYDDNGNPLTLTSTAAIAANTTYDAFNNPLTIRAPGRPDTEQTVNTYGDTDAKKKQHLLRTSTSPLGTYTENTYDWDGSGLAVKGLLLQSDAKAGTGASAPFVRGLTSYTGTGNHVSTRTDARNKTVTTSIDANTDLLSSVTDPNSQTVYYTYDGMKRMTKVHTVTGGSTCMNEYAYTDDKLTQVKHNTVSDTVSDVAYNFSYDALGRASQVCVGTQPLSTNTYNTNGTLQKVQYGNNGEVRYTYDAFKRMTGIRFDSDTSDRYAYTYNSEGRIAYVKDELLDRIHASEYDDAGRPMRIRAHQDGAHVYSGEVGYDSYNNLSSFKEQVGTGYLPYITTFAYDSENKPTTVQYGDAYNRVVNAYDLLGRVTTRTVRAGTSGQYAEYQSGYAYLAGGHGAYSTTPLVSGITQSGHGFAYAYDDVGNILSAAYNGGTPVTYAYDNLGQLTRVNDLYDLTAGGSGTTWVYAYDRGGNIQSKTAYIYTTGTPGTPFQTIAYTYDSTWKDKLASYNGAALTYDAIGNPLTDGTWTYNWQAGRQLASMTNGTTTASFDYNADGLRIRKTIGSTVTDYTLHGKNIVHLTRGSVSLHFFYDAQNRPAVVEYNNGSTTVRYAYVHNLQGDIIAILDPTGTTVVQYKYDAWGKQLAKTGSMASTLGTYNPFRYRGYVFDEETGLYYLRSRYYNSNWKRFICAEAFIARDRYIFACNNFAYCDNNPINTSDPSGHSAIALGAGAALWKFLIESLLGATLMMAARTIFSIDSHHEIYQQTYTFSEKGKNVRPEPGPSPASGPAETPSPPSLPDYPGDDPDLAPEGYEWRGKGTQGSREGSYFNPETGETFRPDLNHKPPIKPHWDYRLPPGNWWRIFADNTSEPK